MSREKEIIELIKKYDVVDNNYSNHYIAKLRSELKGIQDERKRIVKELDKIIDSKSTQDAFRSLVDLRNDLGGV